jgi:phosphatidylglycerophosphate synthase
MRARVATEPAGRRTGRTDVRLTAAVVVAVPLVAVVAWVAAVAPPAPVAVAAVVVALIVPVVAAIALLRRRPPVVSPADRFTLGRVALTGVVSGATVLVLAGELAPRTWLVAAVVGLALALDAVDGYVARRTGTASAAGARLDMESDAALLMVLSVLVAPTVGWWVLSIGALRYLFVAASWIRPRLRGELAFSQFRRVVAALQGIGLVFALIPIVPVPLAIAVVAVVLALLLVSFGRDIVTLERRTEPV